MNSKLLFFEPPEQCLAAAHGLLIAVLETVEIMHDPLSFTI